MRDSFPLQQGVFLSHRQLTPAAGVALSYLHSERAVLHRDERSLRSLLFTGCDGFLFSEATTRAGHGLEVMVHVKWALPSDAWENREK